MAERSEAHQTPGKDNADFPRPLNLAQQKQPLLAEQIRQSRIAPPRRPGAGFIGGQPPFHAVAILGTPIEKVLNRARMNIRRQASVICIQTFPEGMYCGVITRPNRPSAAQR